MITITEVVPIAAIIGGSAAAVWFTKNKFHAEIERSIQKIEASTEIAETEETAIPKARRTNNK